MKVVQFVPALDTGGVERGALEIAAALVAAGHQSLVVSAGGRLVEQLERESSRHIHWRLDRKSPVTLLQLFKLRRWLRVERPDIIHVRSRMPAWVVWLAWRGLPPATRPKLVTTLHGLHSVSRYSEIMGCGERVITVSETAANYLRDHYPRVAPGKIRVIPRGVAPDQFPRGFQPGAEWLAAWQQSYPQLAGKRLVTIAGRLTRLKGHSYFINLIEALGERDIVGLVVGGEDPKRQAYAHSLYREVEARGLSERVIFTGHRSDVREIYAISSLVVSLSTTPESFGRSVLEALAMGVPVAGFNHGGVAEILAALYPAGRVAVADCADLAVVAGRLLAADAPLPAVNEQFTLDKMSADTLAVYRELLQ